MSSKRATKVEKGPATWDTPEYIAECEARSRKFNLRYEDGKVSVLARLIHSWRRKDAVTEDTHTTAALVQVLFQSDERIEQVAEFLYCGVPFMIYRIGSWWFDLSKPEPRRVLVTEA